LAVFHALAQNPEGPCHMLERHQHGSQTFVPLTGARCRLLVALGQDQPDLRTLRLSFSTPSPAQIGEGVERLGRAVGRLPG
jgi:ureidoglycolate hydrolase